MSQWCLKIVAGTRSSLGHGENCTRTRVCVCTKRGRMRTINDRVYGEIAVSDVASRLLSNRWLVRLDQIRQLGACSFVYPSATHTRREHSIGVYHLSGVVASHVRTLVPEITEEDVELVRLAGLLHDVGHGPFSHMYETFWRDRGVAWSHEEQTLRILADELLSVLYDARQWTHTPEENLCFLSGLISGAVREDGAGRSVAVVRALRDVVHSPAGVDADRMDYLLRDTLCVFGSTHTVDATRIIHSMRVVAGGRVAFDQKVALSIQQLFELRTRLHKQVYQHRDVLVVETILREEHLHHHRPCETLDAFCALTDARILEGAPLERLHAYPRMHRVPLDFVVPTCSLCVCGHEFLVPSNFCPACSAPERDSVPPPLDLTSGGATEHARRTTGVPDVHVLIADVTHGSLCDVPFHDAGRPRTLTDEGGRPARYHLRKVYCFTEAPRDDADALGARVADALRTLVAGRM